MSCPATDVRRAKQVLAEEPVASVAPRPSQPPVVSHRHRLGCEDDGVPDITGVITTHLRALGAGTRDRSVFAILTRNPQFIEDEPVTAEDGRAWTDMRNTVDGVLLRFRDGELDSVRVTARRTAPQTATVDLENDFHPYPAPSDLIRGLDISRATRADVTALLGAPDTGGSDRPEEGDSGDLTYRLDAGVLRLHCDGDLLVTVTTSRE